MLPSMPILSTPQRRSNSPVNSESSDDMDVEDIVIPDEIEDEKPLFSKLKIQEIRKSLLEKRSPCTAVEMINIKKSSPLKHVSQILRKYSAQRKAKNRKMHHLSSTSSGSVASSISEHDSDIEMSAPKSTKDEEDILKNSEFIDEREKIEIDTFEPSEEQDLTRNKENTEAVQKPTMSIKRSRHAKEVEATISCLKAPELKEISEKDDYLSCSYFNKVMETLKSYEDDDTLQKFIENLNKVENKEKSEEFIKNIYSILESYPCIAEESLLLFQPGQALENSQFMKYLQMKNIADFLSKLDIFFSKQPHIVRLILSNLGSLCEKSDTTESEVKNIILPLLKSSPLLTDMFLSILPNTAPPESLMEEVEDLICDGEEPQEDEEVYEILHLPSDDYQIPENSTCNCNNKTTTIDLLNNDNCSSCGVKFIHGKIYLQTGKTLRPATISFFNEDIRSATKRLSYYPNTDRNVVNRIRKRTISNSFINEKDSPPKHADDSDNEVDTKNKVKPAVRLLIPDSINKTNNHLLSPTDECSSDAAVGPEDDDEDVILLDEDAEEEEEECFEDLFDDSSQEKHRFESPDIHRNNSTDASNDIDTNGVTWSNQQSESQLQQQQNASVINIVPDSNTLQLITSNDEQSNIPTIHIPSDSLSDSISLIQPEINLGSPIIQFQMHDNASSIESSLILSPTIHIPETSNSSSQTIHIQTTAPQVQILHATELSMKSPPVFINQSDVVHSPPVFINQTEVININSPPVFINQSDVVNSPSIKPPPAKKKRPSVLKKTTNKVTKKKTTNKKDKSDTSSSSSADKDHCWTREEDKSILQAFQQGGSNQTTLDQVKLLLPERTPEQIMSRLQILLKLVQQMSNPGENRS